MNKALQIVKWTVLCVAFVMLLAYFTMVLWNWVVPSVFQASAISFWQSLGILVLSKILFGGWGGGKRCSCGGHVSWKEKYYDRFSSMSPEDRERFKSRMKEKWCTPKSENDSSQ